MDRRATEKKVYVCVCVCVCVCVYIHICIANFYVSSYLWTEARKKHNITFSEKLSFFTDYTKT